MFEVGQRINIEFLENMEFIVMRHMEGGMGNVYKIIQSDFRSEYFGLKMLKSHLDISTFRKECDLWTLASSHPFCVKPAAYGMLAGAPAIAYSWKSSSLFEHRSKDWAPSQIIGLIENLADFFKFATTEHNLLHCDIKPQNILIDENKIPYVTDFGISSRIATTSDFNSSFESPPKIAGTREYMAPELLFGRLPDIKTELYSFGVTIYEFLTGEHPYLSDLAPEKNSRKIVKALKLWGKRLGPNSKNHLGFIAQCISVERNSRPSSFELAHDTSKQNFVKNIGKDSDLIDSIVRNAEFHRKEGYCQQAENLLQKAIQKFPRNPVLFNGLGATYLVSKSREEAIIPLKEASQIVFDAGGFWDSKEYLHPIINLSIQYRCMERYQDAFDLLEKAWKIAENNKKVVFQYADFGWMMVYKGEFYRACLYLSELFKHRSIQPFEMLFFAEAASCSGKIEEYAEEILSNIIYNAQFNEAYFMCAFYLSIYASKESLLRIESMLDSEIRSRLENIEIRSGIPIGGLRPPMNKSTESAVVSEIDRCVTGGRHHCYLSQVHSFQTNINQETI